jgi:hypothetical protein
MVHDVIVDNMLKNFTADCCKWNRSVICWFRLVTFFENRNDDNTEMDTRLSYRTYSTGATRRQTLFHLWCRLCGAPGHGTWTTVVPHIHQWLARICHIKCTTIRRMASICFPLDRFVASYCTVVMSWVSQDRRVLNSCWLSDNKLFCERWFMMLL